MGGKSQSLKAGEVEEWISLLIHEIIGMVSESICHEIAVRSLS